MEVTKPTPLVLSLLCAKKCDLEIAELSDPDFCVEVERGQITNYNQDVINTQNFLLKFQG